MKKEYQVSGKNSTIIFSEESWRIKRFPDKKLVGCYATKELAIKELLAAGYLK
jgi:hypothetical protein